VGCKWRFWRHGGDHQIRGTCLGDTGRVTQASGVLTHGVQFPLRNRTVAQAKHTPGWQKVGQWRKLRPYLDLETDWQFNWCCLQSHWGQSTSTVWRRRPRQNQVPPGCWELTLCVERFIDLRLDQRAVRETSPALRQDQRLQLQPERETQHAHPVQCQRFQVGFVQPWLGWEIGVE